MGKHIRCRPTYAGTTYSAETTINQLNIEIDSVTYNPEFYDLFGGHDDVAIYFTDATGGGDFYRFQMDRMIDNMTFHAHVFDGLPNDCTIDGELFPVIDLGRTIYKDINADGKQIQMLVEVTFEYDQGDSATIFVQSLDEKSATFFDNLDRQLQSIQNPFVEPVFVHSQIEGCLGVFGSAVLSDPFLFIYPQDNP